MVSRLLCSILGAAALIILSACNGGPKPPIDPGCPTGVDVQVRVRYQRQASKAKPDSLAIPETAHRVYGGGQYRVTVMSRVDYYTWSNNITLPENAKHDNPHTIHVGDGALLPNSIITASDIFVNDVLVAKAQFPGGEGEFGSFRVDGCGNVTRP